MAKKKTSDTGTPATITCESCDRSVPAYEVTHVGEGRKYRPLCGPCYFATVSHWAGEDIAHHRLEPIILRDARGKPHTFHFRYSIIPDGHGLEAFEIVRGNPGGYLEAAVDIASWFLPADTPVAIESRGEKLEGII